MREKLLVTLLILLVQTGIAQVALYNNSVYLRRLYEDSSYTKQKDSIAKLFVNAIPGHWGEFVKGVDVDLITQKKIVAFTFDACGGVHGDEYDAELIAYLEQEKVPATLFVSGKWIDANYDVFMRLSQHPLFEIENHGLNHRPCSVDGESEYGIRGTASVPDAFDEIEANERKIAAITGRRPLFYRSATAFTDEACAKLAHCLGVTMVSYDVLSGDAVPFTPVATIIKNVLSKVKPGAIIIMHFNRPKWNTCESLQEIVPELKRQGYSFALLKDYPLKGK